MPTEALHRQSRGDMYREEGGQKGVRRMLTSSSAAIANTMREERPRPPGRSTPCRGGDPLFSSDMLSRHILCHLPHDIRHRNAAVLMQQCIFSSHPMRRPVSKMIICICPYLLMVFGNPGLGRKGIRSHSRQAYPDTSTTRQV